jgi:uncharacterized protein
MPSSLPRFVGICGPNRLPTRCGRPGSAGFLSSAVPAASKQPPGTILLDSPDFPDEYKPEAMGAKAFLEDLRTIEDLDWTLLSPAALLEPGERTGKFRIGGDRLLIGPDGQSRISIEDYAIAVLDELESPRHIRHRFTVAY